MGEGNENGMAGNKQEKGIQRGSLMADWDMTTQMTKQQREAHTYTQMSEDHKGEGEVQRHKYVKVYGSKFTIDDHIQECFSLVYGRGEKQGHRVVGFQSTFNSFNAPGIQLKYLIVFSPNTHIFPLVFPLKVYLHL